MSPNATPTLELANIISTHLATFIFSHLLRSSPRVKALAQSLTPPSASSLVDQTSNAFFVPADGGPPPPPPVEPDDDEPPQTILQIISENLSLSILSRSRTSASDRESREWDRLVAAYLCLLSQWLWEDPASVKDFLDAGGMSTVCIDLSVPSGVFSSIAHYLLLLACGTDQPKCRIGRYSTCPLCFPARDMLRVQPRAR